MQKNKFNSDYKKTIPWKLAVVFMFFCSAIILVGILYYKSQKSRILGEHENNLISVASLKIGQIQLWHAERLGDAFAIKDNLLLIKSIENFLSSNNRETKEQILSWMKSIQMHSDYDNILITDTLFKVRLTVLESDSFIDDTIRQELKAVLKFNKIVMTDLHRSMNVPRVHMDILVPLIDSLNEKSSPFGVAILRVNPGKILFSAIRMWPTSSKSSETLIVRKDGDSVLYLNELRHKSNTSLKLKIPLSNEKILSTKVVNGYEGITEGLDYRNVPVIGYLTRIDGFPWFMVAKVDKTEVLSPLKRYVFLITLVIVLLILITASVFGFWIWQQQVSFFRKQLKNEIEINESKEKFNTAFQMSPVSLSISSLADNKFIDVNAVFLSDLEFTREEVIGKTAKELDIWANEDERLWVINEIKEKRRIFGKVIGFKSKTGNIIYGLTSMSVITVNGKECNLSTVVNITETRNAAEKLKESEDMFRKLFESMLNGFAYCKMILEEDQPLDFIYINVNEAFESLTGLKDVKGRRVSEVIPGIQKADPGLLERYCRVATTGIPEVFEIYVESLKMWFSISVYCPVNGYFVAVFDVITARKLAEEALNESKLLLQNIIDNSNSLIYIIDKEGRFLMANQPLLSILSSTHKKLIGQTRTAFLPEEIAEVHRMNDMQVIKSGKTQIFEEENHETDGIHYYLTTKFPLYNNKHEIYGVGGLSTDITGRKLAEEALRESEDKFKYIFDHSVIGKSITLPTGEINVNKAFCDMTGYSPEELSNTKWQDISHPDDIIATEKMIQVLISGEKDSVRFIKRYIHKNGAVIWTDVGTALRRDKDGTPLYFMTAVLDITERKQAEEEISKLNAELEHKVKLRTELLEAANKELEAFSYSVSHDLRAPLRSVHGYTKILLEEYENKLDDEGKRICGIISSGATQMGELIDDLLNFSRIGRSGLNPGPLDMKSIVQAVFDDMTSKEEKSKTKLRLGKLHNAFGDANLIRLVWNNLISNAVKYSSKEKTSEISIGSSSKYENITYSIRDNGVGFDMNYKHKLFGVFQRLHSEAEFEGNGVGLAIVQRIILKHGGKVWAEGEEGKGATFYFSLPVQDKRQK